MKTSTHKLFTFCAAMAVVVAFGGTAHAQSQATPEAFIGTFMPHGLDGRDYVDRHIALFRDAMQGCYETELGEEPSVAGLMLMRVYIESNGRVWDVEILQNRTGSEALADCVEANIESAQLDPSHRDNVSITLPVTFRMRGGTEVAWR